MDRLLADLERAEADNAEMFKALEGQTTLGLQMAGKWEKAEADLQQATSLLAQDERMREDFIARLDRIAADLQIEQQQHAITANQRDEARSRLHASHIERDDLEARLARMVEIANTERSGGGDLWSIRFVEAILAAAKGEPSGD
jgi:DNA polymerase III delta prime subunit